MAEPSNIWAVLALCATSAAGGAYAMHERQQSAVLTAQMEALNLRNENETLVQEKTQAIADRDEWQRKAKGQRSQIYARDQNAQTWGATVVPKSLSSRVRDAASSAGTAGGTRSDE